MSESGANRQRLAAILAADAAGYSRLMHVDEPGTVAALDAARAAFRTCVETHHGRVIDMAGDSVLAIFETATGAVSAALAVQSQLEEMAAGVPADRRLRFRIGVHMGDVTEKADGTVYGDGVNIAARLEGLALPGGVTVSDAVQGAVRHRIAASFEDLGEQQVKNIVDPVRVYRVRSTGVGANGEGSTSSTTGVWAQLPRGRRRWAIATLALLAIGAVAFGLREPAHRWLGQAGSTRMAVVPTGQAAAITMSMAVGMISVPSDGTLPTDDGGALREDLLGGVGSVERQVRVVTVAPGSQSSSGEFRERARLAGARYVVEGDLRSNEGLRVAGLRLIETQRGTQLWSSRFDLPESAASFEGAAARRRMVRELAVAIENAEITRVIARPVDQLDPMELVVRAWSVIDRGQSVENAQEMRKLVDRALVLDPTLVSAMGAAVTQLDVLNDVDQHPDHERYVRETDQFSLRAVTLDPGNPRAWIDRALALLLLGRWNASLEASERSITLDPYGSRVYQSRAWLMNMMGRPADALPLADKALHLDPSASWSLRVACEAHLLLGAPERAIASCERASGLAADMFHHSFLAAAYANAGDIEHARAALQAMLQTVPGYTVSQLKAKRYSDHPEYQKLAERYWYEGLRKAGLPEK